MRRIRPDQHEQAEEAAQMMELAAEKEEKPALKAELFGQAGQAWTMANDNTRALNAQNEALALAPDNVDLLVDRAFSYRDQEDFRSAVADLDRRMNWRRSDRTSSPIAPAPGDS